MKQTPSNSHFFGVVTKSIPPQVIPPSSRAFFVPRRCAAAALEGVSTAEGGRRGQLRLGRLGIGRMGMGQGVPLPLSSQGVDREWGFVIWTIRPKLDSRQLADVGQDRSVFRYATNFSQGAEGAEEHLVDFFI